MKTITIKQPWASLIVEGIKDIENRTWPTKFRGRVLIHAAAKEDIRWFDICTELTASLAHNVIEKAFTKEEYYATFGNIIGSVEIVDCVLNHSSIWSHHKTKRISTLRTDKKFEVEVPVYNWVLANPIKFPEPIQAKGKLNFWDYPNILSESEEKDGPLFCHCQLPVKEINQVAGDSRFGYYCRYCGGKWYK